MVERVKGYSLSDSDIRKILGNDIKIITYPMLGEMSSIEEAFDAKGRCVMLVPNVSPTMGHWVAMINRPSSIEFFDPYGDRPEAQLDGVPQSRLEQMDEDQPYLTNLMRGSGLPIYYNTHPFQIESGNINTCGRHCVARLMFKGKTLKQYKSIIDKTGLNPDKFVSGLTYLEIKK